MILRADNIAKIYGSRKVVKGISLQVEQGQIVGLLGPNGAGKTTSFYMIVGMVKPNNGRIFLDEEEITTDPMYLRAQKGIGYLAQEASVFRKLSVEDNIMSVLQFTKLSKKEQEFKLESLIEEFNIGHVRKNRGDLLSGGERRRTEIARCLASDPKFILLDEPFAGVDPIAVEDIQYIVAHLKDKNIGILITDHDVQATLAITDKTYLMYNGGILKEGTPEELAADELVRKVYLGKDWIRLRKLNAPRNKTKTIRRLITTEVSAAPRKSTRAVRSTRRCRALPWRSEMVSTGRVPLALGDRSLRQSSTNQVSGLRADHPETRPLGMSAACPGVLGGLDALGRKIHIPGICHGRETRL